MKNMEMVCINTVENTNSYHNKVDMEWKGWYQINNNVFRGRD